jgi:hypothetical protein
VVRAENKFHCKLVINETPSNGDKQNVGEAEIDCHVFRQGLYVFLLQSSQNFRECSYEVQANCLVLSEG